MFTLESACSTVPFRRKRGIAVVLKPQDGGAQDAPRGKVVADPRLESAQVLPDHHGAGTLGLQRENADHGVVVETDVGAVRG